VLSVPRFELATRLIETGAHQCCLRSANAHDVSSVSAEEPALPCRGVRKSERRPFLFVSPPTPVRNGPILVRDEPFSVRDGPTLVRDGPTLVRNGLILCATRVGVGLGWLACVKAPAP